MRGVRLELRIATAEGGGAGQFLARALVDVIEGGGVLERVIVTGSAVDFVFGGVELIRARLGDGGEVVSAELWRCAGEPAGRAYRRGAAFGAALRAGKDVRAIRVQARAVAIEMAGSERFVLDFSEFDGAQG